MSLLSQRIAGQKEEEEDLEDGIVTGTIEGGTTVIEGEVAIGTIEKTKTHQHQRVEKSDHILITEFASVTTMIQLSVTWWASGHYIIKSSFTHTHPFRRHFVKDAIYLACT